MLRRSALAVSVTFALAIALAIMLSGLGGPLAGAQTPRPAAEPVKVAATNDLQRSFEIYNYNVAGTNGAQRGEAIYYFKCWVCHNDFTIAAGSPAPTLKGLFNRAQLRTGDPV